MRKIMLVEDEKMIRYGIRIMIENSGVPYTEIVECRNGKEAVEQLAKGKYDLVLTDIKMPFLGGIELSKWIHEQLEEEHRPMLVAISGYAEFEYIREMMRNQAMDYLLKPVDREEMKKILWKVETKLKESGKLTDTEVTEVKKQDVSAVCKRKMQQAEEYIRMNYGKPLDMAEVSNYVSMNYSVFSVSFKEFFGISFVAYLRKLRIEKAEKYLLHSDLPISSIGEQIGFEDARRFAKVFKEETGMTPSEFREKGIKTKN